MKKPTKTRLTVRVLLIALVVSLGWIFRPFPNPKPELVHPDVLALEAPLMEVRSTFYMDGGTTAIYIRDAEDRTLIASLPTPTDAESVGKHAVFLGAYHYRDAEAKTTTAYPDTYLALRKLIVDYRPVKGTLDRAAYRLSDRTSDFLKGMARLFITRPENYRTTMDDLDLPEIERPPGLLFRDDPDVAEIVRFSSDDRQTVHRRKSHDFRYRPSFPHSAISGAGAFIRSPAFAVGVASASRSPRAYWMPSR